MIGVALLQFYISDLKRKKEQEAIDGLCLFSFFFLFPVFENQIYAA